ncbi:MAG TPA: protein-L-isoaspartate(D-aspartate) O-methyltransferase [Chiayiivirga sp.]|nr:protein-L-isoaspartate(D-aspartate) O-methyltransferase [Chiayiivirga sp.]
MITRLRQEAGGSGMTSPRARERLVESLRANGIRDERVLEAMRSVPRHLFIDEALASRAYEDTALPIGRGQTISQPWVVARMTEALLEAGACGKVLEIGTGSGYQAAVLSGLVADVYSVERIDELQRAARRRFRALGLRNIHCRHEDGRAGWAEHAPYDGILVTAAASALAPELLNQLSPGGVLVAPVGEPGAQQLVRWSAGGGNWRPEVLGTVSFVPLLGGTA